MNIDGLKAPFPPDRVSWRVGSTNADKTQGMALAYIDSRDVQDRLDEVCGVENWQCRYPHADKKTVCEIGIVINGACVWKADGAGDSDVEAEKGALSDAFKRAAVKWGVGRYLYDIESPWVKIVQKGRSYVIDKSELPRLQKLLPGSKAQTATVEQPKPKSAPGVSDAKTWVREHVRELNAAESGRHFMEMVEAARARWARIQSVYPDVWSGPDGSGLRGEGVRLATSYQCRQDYDAFLKEVEVVASEISQQKAAQ